MDAETELAAPTLRTRVPSSRGTENSAKAFSFLTTRSDFLTVAAVAALLATPSAALGDSVSSSPFAGWSEYDRSSGARVLGSNGAKCGAPHFAPNSKSHKIPRH